MQMKEKKSSMLFLNNASDTNVLLCLSQFDTLMLCYKIIYAHECKFLTVLLYVSQVPKYSDILNVTYVFVTFDYELNVIYFRYYK